MSNIFVDADGKAVLSLPAILDLTAAPALKTDLVASLEAGQGLEVDAGNVQRVSSLCLQLLTAAAFNFRKPGAPGLRFSNASPAFLEAASAVAMSGILGLPGVADV